MEAQQEEIKEDLLKSWLLVLTFGGGNSRGINTNYQQRKNQICTPVASKTMAGYHSRVEDNIHAFHIQHGCVPCILCSFQFHINTTKHHFPTVGQNDTRALEGVSCLPIKVIRRLMNGVSLPAHVKVVAFANEHGRATPMP